MPTENRSSNTEMVSVPFEREERYIVIKVSDLASVPVAVGEPFAEQLTAIQRRLPKRECLVIESDWPEYAPTWASIERRVTGAPAPQPHPEPIAWMVGTAFWWSKEVAERDAAAMGLPIVGLGPMADTASADQAKPVGEVVAFGQGLHEIAWTQGKLPRLGAKLYTHADPGEVERLRGKIEQLRAALKGTQERWAKLETALLAQLAEAKTAAEQLLQARHLAREQVARRDSQLAERDALLREASEWIKTNSFHGTDAIGLWERIDLTTGSQA